MMKDVTDHAIKLDSSEVKQDNLNIQILSIFFLIYYCIPFITDLTILLIHYLKLISIIPIFINRLLFYL